MGEKKKEQTDVDIKTSRDKKEAEVRDGQAKGAAQAGSFCANLEEVFRDVALIDPKENIDGVIEEIVRQVRAMAVKLSAEEMAALVLENMLPESKERMLSGLLTGVFQKQAKLKSQRGRRTDELSPDLNKGVFPYLRNYDDDLYKEELYALQVELLKLQRHVKEAGLKIVVVFEGRDAAGKGGTIARFMQNINPRGARIVALPKPTPEETGQWYFQRYAAQLPSPGEMVFFDRSWYNRAVVEPVMGFCRAEQTQLFLKEVPAFERSLVDHGVHLTKFWLDVSREEQKRRFKQRRVDPVRRWKLSPVDIASLDLWDEYTAAIEQMFRKTESPAAPWTIIRSDDKRRARLNAIRVFLHSIEYAEKDEEQIGPVDGLIVKSVPEYLRGYRVGSST